MLLQGILLFSLYDDVTGFVWMLITGTQRNGDKSEEICPCTRLPSAP